MKADLRRMELGGGEYRNHREERQGETEGGRGREGGYRNHQGEIEGGERGNTWEYRNHLS